MTIRQLPLRLNSRIFATVEKSTIKAILFDLDGTLVDSGEDLLTAVNLTLQAYQLPPISYNECIRFVGDGIVNLVSRSFGQSQFNHPEHEWEPEFLDAVVHKYKDFYACHFLHKTVPYPDVEATLQKLRNQQKAVISNKDYIFTLRILKYYRLDPYFKVILGGDSLETRKPDPKPLLYALNQMGVDPSNALMVGDSSRDIEAGKQAGLKTCAVTFGFRDRQELEGLQADYLIDAFAEILGLPGI
jgi:phosphoglycolate phosphatase